MKKPALLFGSRSGRLLAAGLPALACILYTATCLAPVPVTQQVSAQDADPEDLLVDFAFYCMTANPDLAVANGQALLASGLTDAELATLLDESTKLTQEKFDRAAARGIRIPEVEEIASEIANRIENGRLDMARDPERIRQAIEMLTGAQRARMLAQNRLSTAGEYAVPLLLLEITDGTDERLKTQCITVLEKIGRQAVTPLSTALLQLGDPNNQRIVANILGRIGWPHAGPALKELADDPQYSQGARDAAAAAFRAVVRDSGDQQFLAVTDLYTQLGRQYFQESDALIAFPDEETNNIWSYEDFGGLVGTPVPTSIFSEVMAMRSARKALEHEHANMDAVSIFVASNLRRENELPDGLSDPVEGGSNYTPEFYATVFGTQTCLDVLGMAIDSVNTPLVRDAISALAKTTGGSNLFSRGSGRQPLLEALRYPDRRSQYDAALTLARALPTERFAGDFAVVPLLASAVRTGDRTFVLVIADDEEDRITLSDQLDDLGFEVVGRSHRIEDLRPAMAEAVGIDLVVIKQNNRDTAMSTVEALRRESKTTAAPVLLQVGVLDRFPLQAEYRGDRRVYVAVGGGDLELQVEETLNRGSGGRMTEAEAEAYAIESMDALRDIAISGSPAYDITEAEPSLSDALNIRTGGTRLLVADILALIPTDRSQRALFDVALDAQDEYERVELLNRCADSVRQIGDRAEQRHLDALLAVVKDADGGVAEAAARVIGAMNLAGGETIDLILQSQ